MKKIIVAVVLLLMMPLAVYADEQNWQFVQSVGGLSLGTPFRGYSGDWFLSIQMDVSGLSKITTQPTILHSGMVCENVKSEIKANNIYLTVITAVAAGQKSAQCLPVSLAHISPGKYTVYYRGPNEQPVKLSEVSLEP